MSEKQPTSPTATFIGRLAALDPGERARLKRHAGKPLAESADVLGLFYGLLRGLPVSTHAEETFFLLATLYPLADGGGSGDLGLALRRATDANSEEGIRRRLERLLDSDSAQLPFRLRQAVRMLQSKRVRVDWATLLDDLLRWNHQNRVVQRKWARSYFGTAASPDDAQLQLQS